MTDDPEFQIQSARKALADWLWAAKGERHESDDDLADAVAAELSKRHGYELSINWNPSACAFDARWSLQGRTPDDLEKPFSAETRPAAKLLACVGLIRAVAMAKARALRRA